LLWTTLDSDLIPIRDGDISSAWVRRNTLLINSRIFH